MQKILMVCLGNICRSPLAEGILRKKLNLLSIKDVEVDSAGTSNYHLGEHPDRRTIANAKNHNLDISKLKARQFKVNDFDSFDKIFAMDSSNYNDIVALARNEHDNQKVNLLLNVINPELNMSVPDPYFGGEQGFETVFVLIENACDAIANNIKANYTN